MVTLVVCGFLFSYWHHEWLASGEQLVPQFLRGASDSPSKTGQANKQIDNLINLEFFELRQRLFKSFNEQLAEKKTELQTILKERKKAQKEKKAALALVL